MNAPAVMKTLPCPSCGGRLVLKLSRYGPFYGCENWPACTQTHGAHHRTGEPLGIPGDTETRFSRIRAHAAFDLLWTGGAMSRRDAYRWLGYYMGLPEDACHVGRFTVEQCAEVVQLVELWRRAEAK